MPLFDEVVLNNDLFGVHKGETHQTTRLDLNGGSLETYDITPSGRLEWLEYVIEDHSDPNVQGVERCFGMLAHVYTGGLRDMNYHGWLNLTGFGRAKFTDGALVAFEPQAERANVSKMVKAVMSKERRDPGPSTTKASTRKKR